MKKRQNRAEEGGGEVREEWVAIGVKSSVFTGVPRGRGIIMMDGQEETVEVP